MDNKVKSNTFISYKLRNKFDTFQLQEMSVEKIKLLNLQVELEENKEYSFLNKIFIKYFNEWNNKSLTNTLISEIYKRISKSMPEIFFNLYDDPDETVELYLCLISKFISKHKITIDYLTMKRISIIFLNCIHFIEQSKKISLTDFLKKENFHHLPSVYLNFFNILSNIKTINIVLFDDVEISSIKNKNSRDNVITSLYEYKLNQISNNSKTSINNKADLTSNIPLFFQPIIENDAAKVKKETISSEYGYIFYLFLEFIFPNHLEVKLNLNMEKYLDKYRGKKIENIDKIVTKYEHNLLLLLLTTYFISKNKNIQKLSILTNDSLKYEIKNYLKIHQICDKENFLFIDNFLRNSNFYYFNLEFISLDYSLFERLNIIIFKSLSIKSLQITLFPKTNNFNYHSKNSLKRIYLNGINEEIKIEDQDESKLRDPTRESKLPIVSVDSVKLKTRNNNQVHHNSMNSFLDEEIYNLVSNEVLTELFEKFNVNLRNLFLILESKVNILKELKIIVNPHFMIAEKIDYNSALVCFIYNVLKIIENMFNEINTFEIVSETIVLNYNLLGIPLLNNKRKINLRKTNIQNFTFNLKLDGYLNITKFIPESVIYLNLVSISSEIFIEFVEKFKKRYQKYRSLVDLNLGVILTNREIDKLINSTITLFEISKPKSLEIISFTIKYVLQNEDINKVIKTIEKSKNNVKRYLLNFGVTQEIIEFNRLDSNFESKILAYCLVIKKSTILSKVYKITNIICLVSKFNFSHKKLITFS